MHHNELHTIVDLKLHMGRKNPRSWLRHIHKQWMGMSTGARRRRPRLLELQPLVRQVWEASKFCVKSFGMPVHCEAEKT